MVTFRAATNAILEVELLRHIPTDRVYSIRTHCLNGVFVLARSGLSGGRD